VRAVSRPAEQPTRSTVVDALGVGVEVVVRGDRAGEVLARLPELWEFCPAPRGAVRAEVRVVFDSQVDAVHAADAAGEVARVDLEDLLQVLTQRITLAAIDARAGECLMLHAACLADPATGRAAAFVAAGGTGKTTLVRTLGQGRWYVTDETTVVLDDGRVVPYPKPLSVRRAPDSLYKNETAPGILGLRPPQGRVDLAAICLLDRTDEHRGAPRVEALSTLDALVLLVPQTSYLPELPSPLQRLAALSESLGGVHRVTYREAADLAALVDELTGWAA
jgi:hypothetical protein